MNGSEGGVNVDVYLPVAARDKWEAFGAIIANQKDFAI